MAYATAEDVARYLRGIDLGEHEADLTALCEDASAWMDAYAGVALGGVADAFALRSICSQLVVGMWSQGERAQHGGASSVSIGEYSASWRSLAESDPLLLDMLNRWRGTAEFTGGATIVPLDWCV